MEDALVRAAGLGGGMCETSRRYQSVYELYIEYLDRCSHLDPDGTQRRQALEAISESRKVQVMSCTAD